MNSLSLMLLGAACSASLSVGCVFGCDAANNGYRAPVQLTPATTTASRIPATCGVVNSAFVPSDTLSLQLTGDATIQLDLPAGVAVNQAIPLNVTQGAGMSASAQSVDGSVLFTFSTSGSSSTLDGTPVDSVVITVTSLPTADGQPLGAELYVRFDDGRALDEVFSAPLQTTPAACH